MRKASFFCCPGFQSFSNHEELQKEMVKRTPHKIDIGAVYNAKPSDHRKIANFQPQEKELVRTRPEPRRQSYDHELQFLEQAGECRVENRRFLRVITLHNNYLDKFKLVLAL
jgi:hypothetical protein